MKISFVILLVTISLATFSKPTYDCPATFRGFYSTDDNDFEYSSEGGLQIMSQRINK